MTGALERRLFLALAAALFAGGVFAGWSLQKRRCRVAELERALMKESARRAEVERRAEALKRSLRGLAAEKRKRPGQKTAWRERESGKRLSRPPEDCRACLAKVKREVEVRDREHGWWTYHDPDVLDDEPGTFTLTPRFFLEAGGESEALEKNGSWREKEISRPPSRSFRFDKGGILGKPVTSFRLAAGLESYEAEFGYEPVSLRLGRAELLLGFRSRLSLDREDALLRGELSGGIEIRWR